MGGLKHGGHVRSLGSSLVEEVVEIAQQARYVMMLGVKEFLYWHDLLVMPDWAPNSRKDKDFRFWYDPARTTINSVRLRWNATNTCWWNGFRLVMDGREVARAEWGTEISTKRGEADVTDLITARPANGHALEAYAWKFYWPYAYYCEVPFTVTLTVDFSGAQPGVEVPPPPPTPWDYLKWAMIIGGVGVVGIVVVRAIEAVKKK